MSSYHENRRTREDNRNEAAIRTRALVEHETVVRQRALARLVGVLVQRPEPHKHHACPVWPITSRPGCGWPDPPGCIDSTGFSDGIV